MWETPLSENLQKEIVSAYERLCRPIPTNPIELLGYKISFMGEAHLRWLFGEIFMDASYFFHTDNDRPLIFDCGSNIGMSVLFFKKLYQNARIIAFEPDPATFATERRAEPALGCRTAFCCDRRPFRPDRALSRSVAGKFKP
jgi:hypothetical protein